MASTSTHALHGSTLSQPAFQPAWPHILPATLHAHGLHCRDETPASARRLVAEGQLIAEDFLETSPEIERTLMEAFVEDDYEGRLHLATLSTSIANGNDTGAGGAAGDSVGEEIVGMAFWREVPPGEMGEWMDFRRISKAISDRKLDTSSFSSDDEHHADLSHEARHTMRLVKSDSVSWIQSALQPCGQGDATADVPTRTNVLPTHATMRQLTHAWVKIELIAIKRTYRAHHLGHILLGFTLAKAHALHHNEHAILHIAGGGASKNVPAARLYARYGFVSVPGHGEGGPFVKPHRDLFVLGNIGRALGALPWEEVLRLESAGDGEDGSEDGKRRRLLQHPNVENV